MSRRKEEAAPAIGQTDYTEEQAERMGTMRYVLGMGLTPDAGGVIAASEYILHGVNGVRAMNAPYEFGEFDWIDADPSGQECGEFGTLENMNAARPGTLAHRPGSAPDDSDSATSSDADFSRSKGLDGMWYTTIFDDDKPEFFMTAFSTGEMLDSHEYPNGWQLCMNLLDEYPEMSESDLPGKPAESGKP